jgi:hypothetical protein
MFKSVQRQDVMRNETDASVLGDAVASNIKRNGNRRILCRNKKCDVRTMEVHSCNHCCSRKAISIVFWVCVCSLRYPARNAHAPYCHLWPPPLHNIFPHYLINRTIFENKSVYTFFIWHTCYMPCNNPSSLISKCSLSCPQKPANWPYHEPEKTKIRPTTPSSLISKCSSSCQQKPANLPYHEPEESKIRPTTWFSK